MNELELLRRRYDGYQADLSGAQHHYAVLCPLLKKDDGLHLLFEVRAAGLRQGGEVCFPGGRMESGETPAACALRETEEELSIPSEEIELIGTPDFLFSQRGSLVYPVLGIVSDAGFAALHPSPAEVADVFTVPLRFFRDTAPALYSYTLVPQVSPDFPYESVGVSPDYPWSRGTVEVPVWQYQDHAVWGMTARIVRDLIRI